MEIIKSTLTQPRKCEYGDFELEPEAGWKISHSFIDYESRLLIVSVSILDETKWINNGYNGRTIPSREYKIDLTTLSVLTPQEWQKHFNYDTLETISEDKKHKLVSRRVFDPERSSDGYKEELYEVNSGKLISSSDSIAFRREKRETLLERFYNSIKEKELAKRILDAKLTLDQFHSKQMDQLENNDPILCYYDTRNVFQLTYSNEQFRLSKSGPLPSNHVEWKSMKFELVATYRDIDAFWKGFTTDKKWYVKFNYLNGLGLLSSKALMLAKPMISFFNDLRRKHDFTYSEHDKINSWSTLVWSDDYKITEIKQWCFNCYKEVNYQARYPKYICSGCASKNKFDHLGNLVEFSNLGFSGGFRITYKDTNGTTIREDDTQEHCECIIDGKRFFAQEARLGGIVIQAKE